MYTGSTSEFWYHTQQQQEQAQAETQRQKLLTKLHTRRKVFNTAYNVIAIAEIVVFVVGLFLNKWQLADLEENPLVGLNASGLQRIGATSSQKIVVHYQYWRLLSSLFVNAGVLHIWSNLAAFWTFGQFLARLIDPLWLGVVFVFSGLGGILVSANIGAKFITAGASIPAFGMTGAATMVLIYHYKQFTSHIWSAIFICLFLAVNLFIGATPFVDNSGNVAGFVVGAILGLSCMLFRHRQIDSLKGEHMVQFGTIITGAIAVIIIIMGLIGLHAGLPLSGCCDSWVCTPSRLWDCNASRVYPNTCAFTTYYNATGLLMCPKGEAYSISGVNSTTADQLELWCQSYCGLSNL